MVIPRPSSCTLRDAHASDLPQISEVFADNRPTLAVLGEATPEELATEFVARTDLPPGGRRGDEQRLLLLGPGGGVLGVLGCHWGYPGATCLYIGSLFLRLCHQRRGVGRDVVETLEAAAAADGFDEFRVAVGLKNWPALRFWLAMGYSQLTKVVGDDAHGPHAFAVVELAKRG